MKTVIRNLRKQSGMSLVELMISLLIGSILMVGAVSIFLKSKDTYRLNETMGRIQENARLALTMLGPDMRMASFWGRGSDAGVVFGGAGVANAIPAGLAIAGSCQQNWAIDIDLAIDGTNNNFPYAGCVPFGNGAQPGSDVVVSRHASSISQAVATAGRVQVFSTRTAGLLFADGIAPVTPPGSTSRVADLVSHAYYVSQDSGPGPAPFGSGVGYPSLRRKALVPGPLVQDEEVSPGIQDLQVQFGVDTNVVGSPLRGSVNRWVNPGDPIIDPLAAGFNPNAKIVAVKVWLLVRAHRPEPGFTNTRNYVYADQNVTFNDNFRRLLVSETFQLRNTWVN
jgi:type IV pilus assembly protein PilW